MVKGYAAAATALLALSGVNSFGKCTPSSSHLSWEQVDLLCCGWRLIYVLQ